MNRPALKGVIFFYLCVNSFNTVAESEFDAWKRGTIKEFSEYKSKQDKEFAAFLKMNWIGLNALKGKPLYEKKKIIEPPKAPPETPPEKTPDKKAAQLEKPVLAKVKPAKPVPAPSPAPSKIPPPEKIQTAKGKTISVDFFGNNLSFPYDKSMQKRIRGKINKDTVSKQWSVLAKSDYEPLLKQFSTHQKQLKLNDWAYALLVNKVANKLYPDQKNEQVLFSWFVLIKSGYKSRLAYKNRNTYLLLATKQQIYSAQSLTYKNTKYYVLSFDGGKQPSLTDVYTYDGDYPDSKQFFDMELQQAMVTGQNESKRDLTFTFSQKKYELSTTNNKYMVDFMKTYPQVHWQAYFNSNPGSLSRQQVANQLRPHLGNLSEEEAINFLLRFVQTSLKYATDDQQFGYENPLFPEESLFYPASDCEDRSFLFAWLVQELLDLDVIGLHYPGHMATAVKLNMNVNGDTVKYKGKTYLVADPTYINANVGNAMPQFKKSSVEFVEIKRI
ncbi:MAG: hypothetical protein OEX07_07130 [Gammaproteobacteria bacterium]|nr:hypothetical protein [Gammaproteobacteria bacterium]